MTPIMWLFAGSILLMAAGIALIPTEWTASGRRANPSFRLAMNPQMRVINTIRLTIIIASVVVLGGLLAGRITAPLRMLPVPIVLLMMGITYMMGIWLLPERKAANFAPHLAKSFWAFVGGAVLSIVALIMWA